MPHRRGRSGQVRRVVRIARPAGVRRQERDGEEERRPARRQAPDQLDRFPAVDVGLVVHGPGPVGHEAAVLVQRVVVVAVGRRIGRAVPLAPAGRHLERASRAVAVQVLAEMDGGVARALEPGGQRVRVCRSELVVATARRGIPHDVWLWPYWPVRYVVLDGQQRGNDAKLFSKVVPWRARSAFTFCITRIDSTVWSSVISTRMFGLACAAAPLPHMRGEQRRECQRRRRGEKDSPSPRPHAGHHDAGLEGVVRCL